MVAISINAFVARPASVLSTNHTDLHVGSAKRVGQEVCIGGADESVSEVGFAAKEMAI